MIPKITVDLDVDSDYDGRIDEHDEPLEENPGGLVRVRDALNLGLTPITLSLPLGASGVVRMKIVGTGGNKIRIWKEAAMQNQWSQSENIDLGTQGVTKAFYVEGLEASATPCDVQIEVTYAKADGTYTCADKISLTVVKSDLDVDANYDGSISEVDDALEESAGGFTATNVLREIDLAAFPGPNKLTSGGMILSAEAGGDKIKVWDENKEEILLPKAWSITSLPNKLYVEGIEASDAVRDIQLRLCYTNMTFSCRDEIRLTSVQIESIELVGAPSDGLVVIRGSPVKMKANLLPTSYVPPAEEPKWYYNQLVSDGSWKAWTSFGISAYGKTYTRTTTVSGVFQIKTVLSIGDSVLCENVYSRTTSEDDYGPGVIGDPDAFGVVDTQRQISIRSATKTFLGSSNYPREGVVSAQYGFPAYPNPSYKCNIFVAHRAVEAGAVVPAINGTPAKYPPLANEWAGTEDTHPYIPGFQSDIGDWTLYASPIYPQPGFIVAHPSSRGPGHVGVVDYDGKDASAVFVMEFFKRGVYGFFESDGATGRRG